MNPTDVVAQSGVVALIVFILIQVAKTTLALGDREKRFLPLIAIVCGIIGTVIIVKAEVFIPDADRWNWFALVAYGVLNGWSASGLHATTVSAPVETITRRKRE
jgi:Na+-transporting NADH:ubiquinone oxidoreductase subunit NqrE